MLFLRGNGAVLVSTLLFFGCLGTVLGSNKEYKSFNVELKLLSSWPKTSLVSEAVEFISDVDASQVPEALEIIGAEFRRLKNEGIDEAVKTADYREAYERLVLGRLNETLFTTPYAGALMGLVVENRYYSARVEFLRSEERRLKRAISTVAPGCAAVTSSSAAGDSSPHSWVAFCVPTCDSEVEFHVKALCSPEDVDRTLKSLNVSATGLPCNKPAPTQRSLFTPHSQHPCQLFRFDHMIVPFPVKLTEDADSVSIFYRAPNEQNVAQSDSGAAPTFSTASSTDLPFFILFSPLTLSSLESSSSPNHDFLTLLKRLTDQERNPKIPVVFRHGDDTLPASWWENHGEGSDNLYDTLSGYGSELMIKNPEYSTADDSKTVGRDAVLKDQKTADEPVSLEEEEDDASDHIEMKRDHRESSDDIDVDRVLRPSEIEMLGAQAVMAVTRSRTADSKTGSGEEQLAALYKLSANFPQEAVKLSQISVAPAVTAALQRLHTKVHPRTSAVTLNDQLVLGQSPSLFSLLQAVAPHIISIELLAREGVTIEDALWWLTPQKERSNGDNPWSPSLQRKTLPARLDWRFNSKKPDESHAVLSPVWDVMSHPVSANWPSDIERLYIIMAFRGLLKIKAPLHHIVIVIDPLDIAQVEAAMSFLELEVPMRLYVLPVASKCNAYKHASRKWDDRRFGPVPMQFRNGIVQPMPESLGLESCLLRELAGSLFLELLPSARLLRHGVSSAAKLRRQEQIKRAFSFLVSLKDDQNALNKNTLFKRFVEAKGKQSSADVDRVLPDEFPSALYTSAAAYVVEKGLVSNSIVVNGRLLPLQSLTDTVTVEAGESEGRGSPVSLSRILMSLLLEDQQLVVSALLFGRYSFPDDASGIILRESVPTCLMEETDRDESRIGDPFSVGVAETTGRLLTSTTCITLTWSDHLQNKAENDRANDHWGSYKALGREDSLAISSKSDAWLSPALLRYWPVFSFGGSHPFSGREGRDEQQRETAAWPLEFTVITDFTPLGLRLLAAVLKHIEMTSASKTTITNTFKDIPFVPRLRVIIVDSQHSHMPKSVSDGTMRCWLARMLEKIVTVPSEQRTNGDIKLTDRLVLAQNVLDALGILFDSGIKFSNAESLDAVVFSHLFDTWSEDILQRTTSAEQRVRVQRTIAGLKRGLETANSCATVQHLHGEAAMGSLTPLLRTLKEQVDYTNGQSNDHHTRVVALPCLAINGRVTLFTKEQLQQSNFLMLLNFREFLALGHELGTVVGSGLTTNKHAADAEDPLSGRSANVVVPRFLKTYNSSVIGFAGSVRQRLLEGADIWSGPREIYQQSRGVLKVHLGPACSSVPSPLSVYAILDPISSASQVWIPLLDIVNRVLNVDVHILLNPSLQLKEYPLNRWYRQVTRFPETLALSSPSVVHREGLPLGKRHFTGAFFGSLRTNQTLTVGLSVPDTWLVRARHTQYDLDNLRPSSVGARAETLAATFILSNLFLEGQVSPDKHHERTVRGHTLATAGSGSSLRVRAPSSEDITGQELALHAAVQYSTDGESGKLEAAEQLGRKVSDTVVMGNLGYFQLRGYPGLFFIALEKHTQLSASPFRVASMDHYRLATDGTDYPVAVPIVINALAGGAPRQIRLVKSYSDDALAVARSYEFYMSLKEKALTQFYKSSPRALLLSFSHTVAASWTQLRKRILHSECTEPVHIFSLASGFMYERLLRIMILSVRKHTTCPLTFWFIGNFLSAKFREIMPAMAERYRLEYHYVTYKWPSWLRKQTEKQRQIWAYKILFLDVLFPNAVKKVIYIDADQVVRGDVYDLWNIDLKGRVYGFTPFCESREETRGLRFWKEGYWKNHLNGKPYHISALFVVDLVRYRQQRAGDLLRAAYATLSQDRNSLANLDQDLPNFAQHEIPIFPLPQEWLWCETWCSNASLGTAKTIDLCNNPMTKEPKLSQARRILPEWIQYDQEIRNLEQEVFDESIKAQARNQLPGTGGSLSEYYPKKLVAFPSRADDEL